MAPTRQKGAIPPAPLSNGHDTDGELPLGDGPEIVVIDDDGEQGKAPVGDPGIEDLRKQLADEKAAREAAERDRDALRQVNNGAAKEIADNRLLVIQSNIDGNETKKADVMRRIIEAKEAGDYTAETNAQAELAEITLDLKQARLGKSRLEMEIEDGRNGQQQQTGDALDQYFAQNNVHPRAQNWLRGHRDYIDDASKTPALTRAHFAALGEGAALNSDDYFRIIEERLGLAEPETATETPAPPSNNGGRQASAPAAPVSRSANLGGGARLVAPGITQIGPGKYNVTAEVREAAQISGLPIAVYIEEALKLTRGSDGQLH